MYMYIYVHIYKVPPFNDAIPSDWWWRRLETGWQERSEGVLLDRKKEWSKHGLFWAAHERSRAFPARLKDFLLKLLHPDPEQRPTIDQIRKEEWKYYRRPKLLYGSKEIKLEHFGAGTGTATGAGTRTATATTTATTTTTATVSVTTIETEAETDKSRSWFQLETKSPVELARYLETRLVKVRAQKAKKIQQHQELNLSIENNDELNHRSYQGEGGGRGEGEGEGEEGGEKREKERGDNHNVCGSYRCRCPLSAQDQSTYDKSKDGEYFHFLIRRFYAKRVKEIDPFQHFDTYIENFTDGAKVDIHPIDTRTVIRCFADENNTPLETEFEVRQYRFQSKYLVLCKRLRGDPLSFKYIIDKFWSSNTITIIID
ncbi:hypothetical protein RFI_27257, partial [Reticulomyxa filosa]